MHAILRMLCSLPERLRMHIYHQNHQISPVIVGTITRTRVATMYRVSSFGSSLRSSVCVCASYGGGEEDSSVGRGKYVCFCAVIITTEFAAEYIRSIGRVTSRS